jgi:ATP-dependent DNA ligase
MTNDQLSPMLLGRATTLPQGDGWAMEPKFDGWRFIVHIDEHRNVTAYTRTLNAGYTLWGVEERLAELFPAGTVLDMEVCVPGGHSTDVPTALATPSRGTLVAYVFDVMMLNDIDCRSLPYDQRRWVLEQAMKDVQDGPVRLTLSVVPDAEVLDAWLADGMEGVVLKRMSSRYKPGRGNDWLKIKPQFTVDVTITGFAEGAGKRQGQVATVDFVYNGETICATVADWDAGTDMFLNPSKYLGRICEVAYNGPTSLGYLRHPQFVRMRPDLEVIA